MYLAPLPSTLAATLDLVKAANVRLRRGLVRCSALAGDAHAIAGSGLVNTQLGPGEFLENFAIWPADQGDRARSRALSCRSSRHRSRWTTSPGWPRALLTEPDPSHYGRMYPITGPQSTDPRLDRRTDRRRHGCRGHLRALRVAPRRNGLPADHGPRRRPGTSTRLAGRASTIRNRPTSWSPTSPAHRQISVAQWAAENADAFR